MDRQIKNRANGITSTFTQAQWDKVRKDPQWQNTFEDVTPETPKEVQEAKKAADKAETKTQAQPAAEKKTDTGNNNTNQTTK